MTFVILTKNLFYAILIPEVRVGRGPTPIRTKIVLIGLARF